MIIYIYFMISLYKGEVTRKHEAIYHLLHHAVGLLDLQTDYHVADY